MNGPRAPRLHHVDLAVLEMAALTALGPRDPDGPALAALATLFLDAGQFAEAADLLGRASRQCDLRYGAGHPVARRVRSRRRAAEWLQAGCGYA